MGPSGGDREETYWQRVSRIQSMLNLSTVAVTPSELEQDLDAIRRSEAGEEVDGARLDRAHRNRDSILHPDTGKPIFAPLRLSMIVPMNCMLDVLMISARSFGATVVAQWANQTYNALHYYANRNASNAEPMSQRVGAYLGATASSVGTALGLRHWASHLASVRPKRAASIRRMAPFCAVAAADLLNLGITRKNEYLDGITVRRKNGEELGRSRVAGAFSVATCVFGRVGAAAPVLLVSPLIMARLEHRAWLVSRPWLRMPIMVGIVGCMITTAVPLVFGVFKQTAHLPVSLLEPEFRHLTEDDGTTPAELMFNKGL